MINSEIIAAMQDPTIGHPSLEDKRNHWSEASNRSAGTVIDTKVRAEWVPYEGHKDQDLYPHYEGIGALGHGWNSGESTGRVVLKRVSSWYWINPSKAPQ